MSKSLYRLHHALILYSQGDVSYNANGSAVDLTISDFHLDDNDKLREICEEHDFRVAGEIENHIVGGKPKIKFRCLVGTL